MNQRIFVLLILTFILIGSVASFSANCPAASRVDSCSPQCKEHTSCTGGKMCCTNICGSKSCVDMYGSHSGGSSKNDKYSKSGATGTYCGNTKCQPQEKCEMDRRTNRMQCVRA